jgi:hypothetical protein
MPLSEHEQRVLAEIERDLYADDAKLVTAVRSAATPRSYRLRRIRRACLLYGLGLAVLVAAVAINSGPVSIILGLLGFVVMLFAALRGSGDLRRMGGRPARAPAARSKHSIAEWARERWQDGPS